MKTHRTQYQRTWEYLDSIGVPDLKPRLSAFDPGYDPGTLEGHLEQSSHFLSSVKISMACWQIANESSTRKKVQAAHRYGVPVCTGGGPFEVSVAFGKFAEYLDLCAYIGVDRIEAGEGFIDLDLNPKQIVSAAAERGLEVQFEVGKKHGGSFSTDTVGELIDQGRTWLEAGAVRIVVEARESAQNIGIFGDDGQLDFNSAERFYEAFGPDVVVFEAPDKASQFGLLSHFGPDICLMNVRLEEILRVEIFRRGLHSDAFQCSKLRPAGPNARGEG